MNNEKMKGGKFRAGRKPMNDPANCRYTIRLNEADNARFLTLFEQSGMKRKSAFIRKRIFSEGFKVIKIDKTSVEYYNKLTELVALFRKVGVNYNQVVKLLHSRYNDKMAWALMEKLHKMTTELMESGRKIHEQNEKFRIWLQR
ncbi:conjugal transfer protein MobA [Petrimonas sp.]|uniref:conjugal transfer protein MobA n=1 Tax=Petrimonas sp. TaxID=2023866 RepID=UPI003F51A4CF